MQDGVSDDWLSWSLYKYVFLERAVYEAVETKDPLGLLVYRREFLQASRFLANSPPPEIDPIVIVMNFYCDERNTM